MLCSADPVSWAQVSTQNTSCCLSLGGQTAGDIWTHVGQGLGWLHTLSPFVNVTLLGAGHRKVGFLARGFCVSSKRHMSQDCQRLPQG